MDITPTREFLDDLRNRLEKLFFFDDESAPLDDNAQIDRADLLVLVKALRVATDIWRPVPAQAKEE